MRHWVWLSTIGLSITSEHILLDRYEDPERIYEASEDDLRELLPPGEAAAVLSRRSLGYADKVLEDCAKLQVQILTIRDALYPNRLRNIDSPPIVLYVRGTMPVIDDEVAITVVGTRKPSDTGAQIAETLAYDLAQGGALIISGMAEGIDGAAHRGALRAGKKTIAVFGCGIDHCYPAFHEDLMKQIIANGCVISEYAPGMMPARWTFPARNRIMAGLSLGTLVVSAPMRSGSLITANIALDQGRDVFCVPGALDDATFEGSNDLIKTGATPVTEAGDILDTYSFRYPQLRPFTAKETEKGYFSSIKKTFGLGKKKKGKTAKEAVPAVPVQKDAPDADAIIAELTLDIEKEIIAALAAGFTHADQIVEETQRPAKEVLSHLTMLELAGFVRRKPGNYFELIG